MPRTRQLSDYDKIKVHLTMIQNTIMDQGLSLHKAIILEHTIRAWRIVKKMEREEAAAKKAQAKEKARAKK